MVMNNSFLNFYLPTSMSLLITFALYVEESENISHHTYFNYNSKAKCNIGKTIFL